MCINFYLKMYIHLNCKIGSFFIGFSLVGYIGCDVARAAAKGLLPPVRPAQDAGEQAAHPREGQQTGKLL